MKSAIAPLKIYQLKEKVYRRFRVASTKALRKAESFGSLTQDMGRFDFRYKSAWERLYRKFIGILPGEPQTPDYGRINGVDIFNEFNPWKALRLDRYTARRADIKQAYYGLARIYHPDNQETGNSDIFSRLSTFYTALLSIA